MDQIERKYLALKGASGILGRELEVETDCPDRVGRYMHYERGSIYWHPATGAYEVHGAIRETWASLGSERSVLGYPITDEVPALDGLGRVSHFQYGAIFWSPDTGAHEVHGAIAHRWVAEGGERGRLGYPLTDESTTPDGAGRFNHFQHGSIYWSPQTGAHVVSGTIREKWAEQGWEQGALGYPVSDELELPDGRGRYVHFQGGFILWRPGEGAWISQNLSMQATAPVMQLQLLSDLPDPTLEPLAEQLLGMLMLAADRVAAHHNDAANFRVPTDSSSFEALLAQRFSVYAPDKQRELGDKARRRFDRQPGGRLWGLRNLSIDPLKLEPAQFQVAGEIERTAAEMDWPGIADMLGFGAGAFYVSTTGTRARRLQARIRYVHCTQETDEPGTDSIGLGGLGIDSAGNSVEIPAWRVGEFSQNPPHNIKTYQPPRVAAEFDLQTPGAWPRTHVVSLWLAERDWGNFPEWLHDVYQELRGYVKELVEEEYGPFAAAIADWVMRKFLQWLMTAWEDDVYQPITVTCTAPSPTAWFLGGSADEDLVLKWSGHGGEYFVTLNWHLTGSEELSYSAVFEVLPLRQEVATNLSALELQWRNVSHSGSMHLTHVQPNMVNQVRLYDAIWQTGAQQQQIWPSVRASRILELIDQLRSQGYGLAQLHSFVVGGEIHYAGIWNQSSDFHDAVMLWSRADVWQKISDMGAQGFRLLSLQGLMLGAEERFNATWRQEQAIQDFVIGYSREDFEQVFVQQKDRGWYLAQIQTYSMHGVELWNGVWEPGNRQQILVQGYAAEDFRVKYRELESQGLRLTSMSSFMPIY